MATGKLKTFWKQQGKVENSAEKLQNGAAGAGKRTPSRPTKKPNRLKMVGHLYKTHLENRSSTFLILRDTTKKRACGILYVTGSWCAWRDSNPRHLASENYDKPVQTNVEAWILLVLHSCVQSKKTPVGGCHNGLFGVLRCVCTVVVKWWSKNVK